MRTTLFAAVAGILLVAAPALAQQSPHASGSPGNNIADPFAMAVGSPALPSGSSQSAHNALPTFGFDTGRATPVVQAALLPERGTNGPVDTANSLPVGFNDGSPAMQYALSVQRYFASQAITAQIAAGALMPHG